MLNYECGKKRFVRLGIQEACHMAFEYETDEFLLWLWGGFADTSPTNPNVTSQVPDTSRIGHICLISLICPSPINSNAELTGHVTWFLSTKPMIFCFGFGVVLQIGNNSSAVSAMVGALWNIRENLLSYFFAFHKTKTILSCFQSNLKEQNTNRRKVKLCQEN
jgi:hypothetical protein